MQTYESDANIGNIKILAVDMDKTLLTDERVLPQGLDERLDKLADAGIVFCPASGRPAPKLEEMFEGIKNRLAFCPDNGACVIYRGSYIYKSNIDVELYQQVLNRASEDPRAVPVLCCVAHLCEHLGIDIADAAAVGDTYNDIPMLERVGHSFIVDNAEEHMNAHAKWRIPSNNDGGVLTLIDAILAAR